MTMAIIGKRKAMLWILDAWSRDLAIIKVIEKKINMKPIVDPMFTKYTLNNVSNCPFVSMGKIISLKIFTSNDVSNFDKRFISIIWVIKK